jgi:hypothetical protein
MGEKIGRDATGARSKNHHTDRSFVREVEHITNHDSKQRQNKHLAHKSEDGTLWVLQHAGEVLHLERESQSEHYDRK